MLDQAIQAHGIGVIAGNGIYPRLFCEGARRAGVGRIVVSAFKGETVGELEEEVEAWTWLRVGQLSKMISFFKKQGVSKAVMVGQIAPRNLFDLRPDMKTLVMLGKLKERNAESIFGAIAQELAKEGVELISATTFLEDCLPEAGHVAGPKLKAGSRLEGDVEFGFGIAKEVSRLDIGQTVVVRGGTVLAVEAFEGTNEAIKRGGGLGKGEAVMVKVSKPNQDFRFDVPVVGPETIATAVEAGIKAIVVEAEKTLLLDQAEVLKACDAAKISLVAEKEGKQTKEVI